MNPNDQPINSKPTNKHSIISLILGMLTLLIFCGSIIIPIPLTSFICAPVSALVGIAAMIYGLVSLQKIKKHNEAGHPMAWTGILIGSFVILCILFMAAAIIVLIHFAPDTFPIPQFIQKFQI